MAEGYLDERRDDTNFAPKQNKFLCPATEVVSLTATAQGCNQGLISDKRNHKITTLQRNLQGCFFVFIDRRETWNRLSIFL
jgi:hypothetical protein